MLPQPDPTRTHVIAVGNQKGGVGKTTNTVHLAAALGQIGKKCLIWDLDMNHGATLHLGVPPEAFDGTFMVLAEERRAEEVIIDEKEPDVELPPNVHLIPSSRDLERLEAVLAAKDRFYDPRRILVNPISSLRGKYDYIFLDTAPNATAPTIASYVAAGIAGADMWRISLVALRFCASAYLLPFLFVYNPAILLHGSAVEIAIAAFTAIMSGWVLAYAVEGGGRGGLADLAQSAALFAAAIAIGSTPIWLGRAEPLAALPALCALVAFLLLKARKKETLGATP